MRSLFFYNIIRGMVNIYNSPDKKDQNSSLSRCRQRFYLLTQRRERLEQMILGRAKLIKGCLARKYKMCGKGNCKCTQGKPHGPQIYLSVSVSGKAKMIFIPKKEQERVKRLATNYKQFRKAREQIVKINKEILSLTNEIERLRTEEVKRDGRNK